MARKKKVDIKSPLSKKKGRKAKIFNAFSLFKYIKKISYKMYVKSIFYKIQAKSLIIV